MQRNTAAVSFFNSIAAFSAPVVQAASTSLASAAASAANAAAAYFTAPAAPSSAPPDAGVPAANIPSAAGAKPSKRRDRTSYERNVTAALALPATPPKPKTPTWSQLAARAVTSLFYTPQQQPIQQPPICDQIKHLHRQRLTLPKEDLTDAQKKALDQLTLAKIDLLAEQIIEHAARRTDLFFYACVAVYKTKAIIADGPTIEQHGIGSNEHGTHACHSALFSNIQLASLLNKHLARTNNMTVELPAEVNDFDKHIERSGFVDNMIVVLNKVSMGSLNPQQGMTEFLKNINFCFEKFNTKYLYDEHIANKPPVTADTIKIRTQLESYRHIWELQRTGTFKAAIQGQEVKEVDPYYIYSMLRLNTFVQRNFQFLETHFMAMQHEINASESTFSPRPQ